MHRDLSRRLLLPPLRVAFLHLIAAAVLFSITRMHEAMAAPTAQTASEGLIQMESVGGNGDGYFVVDGKPGQPVTVTVNVRNLSADYPASAMLLTSDAVVAQGGGMGTVSPEKAKHDLVGGWFEQPYEQSINLKAGESRDIPLHFTIPQNAGSGDHVGSIELYKLVKPASVNTQTGKNTASVVVNKAYVHTIAIHVKIPGPAEPKLELSTFKPIWNGSDLFYELSFDNTGNTIEKASGKIELFAQDGTLLTAVNGNMGSIYPGTVGTYVFKAPDSAKTKGTYKVHAVWNYDGLQTAEKTFETVIADKEAHDAELSKLADANPDKKYATDAIVISPKTLILYIAIGLSFAALLFLGLFLWLRKRLAKTKIPRDPPSGSGPNLGA